MNKMINKKILLPVLGVLLLIITFLGGIYYNKWSYANDISSVNQDVYNILNNVQEGRHEQAYSKSTDDFRELISQDDFKASVGVINKDEGLTVGPLFSSYKSDSEYMVQYELHDKEGGLQSTVTFFVARDNSGNIVFRDYFISE